MRPLPFMVDSGAFSAWAQDIEISLEDYATFAHDVVARCPDALIVNLDVINDGARSFANWQELRKLGLKTLPVYHVSTDMRWLKKYLHYTDHIGLGAISNITTRKRHMALDRLWQENLTNKHGQPTCRVHGMGLTAYGLMSRYPWHSIDSTSPILAAAYGRLLIPQRRRGMWDYGRKPNVIIVSDKSPHAGTVGKGYRTLPRATRRMVREYLRDIGLCLGSKHENADGEYDVQGVRNHYNPRMFANMLFYAKFFEQCEWPRVFSIQRDPGLFSEHTAVSVRQYPVQSAQPTLFFGGNVNLIDTFQRDFPEQFTCTGTLLSYWIIVNYPRALRRLETFIEEHRNANCETRAS